MSFLGWILWVFRVFHWIWYWAASSLAKERENRGREKGKRRRSHNVVRRSSPVPVLAAHAWVWWDPRDPRRSLDPRRWKREEEEAKEKRCHSPKLARADPCRPCLGLVRPTALVLPNPGKGILVKNQNQSSSKIHHCLCKTEKWCHVTLDAQPPMAWMHNPPSVSNG